jgi:hypothetical protein
LKKNPTKIWGASPPLATSSFPTVNYELTLKATYYKNVLSKFTCGHATHFFLFSVGNEVVNRISVLFESKDDIKYNFIVEKKSKKKIKSCLYSFGLIKLYTDIAASAIRQQIAKDIFDYKHEPEDDKKMC